MDKKTALKRCCVPFCESHMQKGMFQFPKDITLKQKWLDILKLDSHGLWDVVCIKHFREKYDYCQLANSGKFKLAKDAVPSLCLPQTSHINVSFACNFESSFDL